MSCQTRRPILVAQVVEVVRLVAAASPHAQHVHVRGLCRGKQAREPVPSLALRQRVAGDPVGALAEDGHAVDPEAHGEALCILPVHELQRPQPEALARAVTTDGHGEIVQRLLAVPVGPPQPWIPGSDVDPRAVGALRQRHGLPRGLLAQAHFQLLVSGLRGGALDMNAHPAAAAGVVLFREEVVDADTGCGADEDVTLDPADHEAGAPVPPGMALDLAHEVPVRRLDRVLHVRDGVGELLQPPLLLPFRRNGR